MKEIEKNFDLRPGDKERIIQGAGLLRRLTFTDVYYDTPDFSLTGNDYWLRTRDGKWELKAPLNKKFGSERRSDQYEELETEEEIGNRLEIAPFTNLKSKFTELGYKPFATITTKRESYEKEGFHLDFDEMDFGFTTFEVELMVKNQNEITEAEKRILDFAEKNGIFTTAGEGKVFAYLRQNNKKHYDFLINKRI